MRTSLLSICALLVVACNVGAHEETVQYTVDNFADEVVKKNHFVMFYAPWCGHCKRFFPTWEELAEMLNTDGSNIRIAKVDCTTDSNVCKENEVTGYPTFKFFKAGGGSRDLPSLTSFIKESVEEAEDNLVKIPEPEGGLIKLTEDTFDKHVSSGKHFIVNEDNSSNVITLTGDNFESGIEKGIAFVKFFVPWCGHSRKVAPTWEELGKKFMGHPEVNIVKIDCTLDPNKQLCSNAEVHGFPTFLLYKDGKKISQYSGDRNLQDFYEFVQHAGSSQGRAADFAPTKLCLFLFFVGVFFL